VYLKAFDHLDMSAVFFFYILMTYHEAYGYAGIASVFMSMHALSKSVLRRPCLPFRIVIYHEMWILPKGVTDEISVDRYHDQSIS
jgi:hypothetical protein